MNTYDDHPFVEPDDEHPDHLDNGGAHLCQWPVTDDGEVCSNAADNSKHRSTDGTADEADLRLAGGNRTLAREIAVERNIAAASREDSSR